MYGSRITAVQILCLANLEVDATNHNKAKSFLLILPTATTLRQKLLLEK